MRREIKSICIEDDLWNRFLQQSIEIDISVSKRIRMFMRSKLSNTKYDVKQGISTKLAKQQRFGMHTGGGTCLKPGSFGKAKQAPPIPGFKKRGDLDEQRKNDIN